uniref:Ribosomal protein S10 n=1 Tax=Panagrolaimus sp. ES5 TaxID=591445 RepID=A0AC34FKR4_9BILA
MTESLRDSLNLKSLTIINSFRFEFAPFCCKTSSLIIYNGLNGFERCAPKISDVSPFLSLIKDLTFNETYCYMISRKLLTKMTKYFPSLESLNFNITLGKFNKTYEYVEDQIKESTIKFVKAIKHTIKVPEKITCTFYKFEKDMKFPNINLCKRRIFHGFKFDASIMHFRCFHKIIQTAGLKTTILEVRVAK